MTFLDGDRFTFSSTSQMFYSLPINYSFELDNTIIKYVFSLTFIVASVGLLIAAGVSSLLRSPAREKLAAALSIVITVRVVIVVMSSSCCPQLTPGAGAR